MLARLALRRCAKVHSLHTTTDNDLDALQAHTSIDKTRRSRRQIFSKGHGGAVAPLKGKGAVCVVRPEGPRAAEGATIFTKGRNEPRRTPSGPCRRLIPGRVDPLAHRPYSALACVFAEGGLRRWPPLDGLRLPSTFVSQSPIALLAIRRASPLERSEALR